MTSSWPPPARKTVYGLVFAGVLVGLWLAVPTAWSPEVDDATGRRSDDDRTLFAIYPSESAADSAYRRRAKKWATFWDRRFDVRVRPDSTVTLDSLRGHDSFVVGTPSSPLVASIFADAGITSRKDGAFVVGNRTYADSSDVLLLERPYAEDPNVRSEGRLHLVVSQTDAGALPYAYTGPFLASGLPATYKIVRDGRLLAYGRLNQRPSRAAGACTIPPLPARHVDLSTNGAPDIETDALRVYDHRSLDPSMLQAFAARRTDILESTRLPIGEETPFRKIEYHLFRRHAGVRHFRAPIPPMDGDVRSWLRENWRRSLESTHSGLLVDSNSGALAMAVKDGDPPISPAEVRHWRQVLPGRPVEHGLEPLLAVGRVASETAAWETEPIKTRVARLHRAGLVPNLQALGADTTFVHKSKYVQIPIGAALYEYLEEAVDVHAQSPSTERLHELNPGWQEHLDSLVIAQHPDSRPPAIVPDDFVGANVAFATGPSGASSGYASPRAEASLTALKDLGATAASIVPYTAMPDPHAPADLLARRHYQGTESDPTIERAIETAHDLGLRVMLKPQIGGEVEWPGDIEMASEADWDAFFDDYSEWILHYALMAQWHDVEMLAIGTELASATSRHEAEWRQLVERIRRVYDGAITYAANWHDEAERLPFADALDAVGIDAYYPLSADPNATDRELRAGADEVAARIEQIATNTEHPVLLTEWGFPNTKGAWAHPHEKREDKPEGPMAQARAARALTAALSDAPIRGALWWRWPPVCRFGYGRFEPTAPTREVLHTWFKQALR